MITNDVLRSLRYSLNITEAQLLEILQLTDYSATELHISQMLLQDDQPDYLACPEKLVASFLDGLILHLRGRNEQHPLRPLELPLTNNIILKKLRAAFALKEQDVLDILDSAGVRVSKSELSALFRKAGQSNYRLCGDQFLRNFLKGLALRERHANLSPTA